MILGFVRGLCDPHPLRRLYSGARFLNERDSTGKLLLNYNQRPAAGFGDQASPEIPAGRNPLFTGYR